MEFKVHYFDSNQINEVDIRRINIGFTSFSFHDFSCYLKNLINLKETDTIFIKLRENNKWLITEKEWNDFVSSNSENDIVKLNVYFGNVHFNVQCDNCRETVVGDRFKCLECDDYDICQRCFQTISQIHSEHCLILLRKPEDSEKFIKSIPLRINNGTDFRVVDINIDQSVVTQQVSEKFTQTDSSFEQNFIISDKTTDHDHSIDKDRNSFEIMDVDPIKSPDNIKCVNRKIFPQNLNNLFNEQNYSCVSKEYYESLPKEIHKSIDKLKAMGFTNINDTLVALLVAHNGNIYQVLDELEYSTKH